jgi:uncharacterized membrane protein YphA (DoxX/SURF4 family)
MIASLILYLASIPLAYYMFVTFWISNRNLELDDAILLGICSLIPIMNVFCSLVLFVPMLVTKLFSIKWDKVIIKKRSNDVEL